MTGLRRWLIRGAWTALGPLLLLAVWVLVRDLTDVQSYILPSPWAVAEAAWNERSALLSASWVTVKIALIGFLVSVAVSIPLAILIDSSWRAEKMLYPLLVGSQVVPVVVFAPIFFLWFGFNDTPGILTVAIICLFPICMQMVEGLRAAEQERVDLVRTMGASRLRQLWAIKVPGALPSAFTGLKLGIAVSLIGAIVAEFVASNDGLGHLLLTANTAFHSAVLFAGVFYISVIGLIMFGIVELLERQLIHWQPRRRLEVLEAV